MLYGGAAGGGKSYAMLVDPLRFMHRPSHRALLLRRAMPELRELIDKSRELYPKAFPGAKFREVEKIWRFPSGALLEFGYLDRDADVYRYQGQAYSWIGIDELTQYPTEFPLQYLQSRLRTTDPEIKTYIQNAYLVESEDDIGITQLNFDIRNLIDQVRFAPQVGRYNVYIIDEAHMLSSSAFNASSSGKSSNPNLTE